MVFASRGSFEFALSPNSLREVEAAADDRYLRWAYDVLGYWQACIGEAAEPFDGSGARRAALLDGGGFGYLSAADALLIRDALLLECDTFLTVERKLAKNAGHVRRTLGIEVLRPPEMWELMRPHVVGL